jgi:predicted DNA-binding protein (UPF0251 family)
VLSFPGYQRRQSGDLRPRAAQIRRLIEVALDDLPEAFRLVFILREVEELSVEETAAHLGIRTETVKTRLHRARRRLRDRPGQPAGRRPRGRLPLPRSPLRPITERVLSRMASVPPPGLGQLSAYGGASGPQARIRQARIAGAFRVRFMVKRETIFTTAAKSSEDNRNALAVPIDAVARVC